MQKLGKKNICFTGMMGSGKSVIGKKFAKIIIQKFQLKLRMMKLQILATLYQIKNC